MLRAIVFDFDGVIANSEPLHFAVYSADPAKTPAAPPIGYAFSTTDLVPQEHGYHGPIHILVGMDLTGILTGVIVSSEAAAMLPKLRTSMSRPLLSMPCYVGQFTSPAATWCTASGYAEADVAGMLASICAPRMFCSRRWARERSQVGREQSSRRLAKRCDREDPSTPILNSRRKKNT